MTTSPRALHTRSLLAHGADRGKLDAIPVFHAAVPVSELMLYASIGILQSAAISNAIMWYGFSTA